jgi:hypothetical protein
LSPAIIDLIRRLLHHDPTRRLGCPGYFPLANNGLNSELKQHAAFTNFDWEDFAKNEAPFIPAPADATDTSYFTPSKSLNQSMRLWFQQ